MSKIIGIDLGTTNSCVAVMEGGDAVVIGSISYLVFPEYEEEVRGMLLSAPAYQPEY